jgi:transcriptional regulator with XRE-family HTH domain
VILSLSKEEKKVRYMEFKDMLKYFREQNNWTQEELGKRVGLSPSAIGMYERGIRHPDQETEERLADIFNVSLDTLRGRNISSLEHYDALVKRLTAYANALNALGKKKLLERAEELAEVPKYVEDSEKKEGD